MESDLVQSEKLEERRLLQEKILGIMYTQKYRKVRDLINELKKSSNFLSIEAVHDAVRELEYEGKIKLHHAAVQGSFFNYISKNYYSSLKLWLSLILISISLGSIYFFPSLGPFSLLRIIAGGIAVFFIPGYGLIRLLFPRKDFPPIERIGLSLILSLLIIPMLWLALDWLRVWAEINSVIYVSVAGILVMFASTYRQFQIQKLEGDLHGTG